jgi:hypothetical protein
LSPAGTDDREIPHPRATAELFGHAEAERRCSMPIAVAAFRTLG